MILFLIDEVAAACMAKVILPIYFVHLKIRYSNVGLRVILGLSSEMYGK